MISTVDKRQKTTFGVQDTLAQVILYSSPVHIHSFSMLNVIKNIFILLKKTYRLSLDTTYILHCRVQ